MRTLANYISDDQLILHCTDIVFSEVERQIHEFITKLSRDAQVLAARYESWKEKAPKVLKGSIPEIDADALGNKLFRSFKRSLRNDFQVNTHDALDLPSQIIFERYFKRQPPFANGKKEFPDAYMIEVLEKWCQQHGSTMYIVTKDGPMQQAAEQSDFFHSVEKIEDLFKLVTAEAPSSLIEHIDDVLNSGALLFKLETFVSDNIGLIVFIYAGDLTDGEIDDVSTSDEIHTCDFSLLSFSDDKLEIMVDLIVPINAEIYFDDYSSASYDNEDGIYFGVESGKTTIEDSPVIRVFLTINPKNDEIVNLELVTQELHISEPYNDYK